MTNLKNALSMHVLYFYAPTRFSYEMKKIFMRNLKYDFSIRCMGPPQFLRVGFCTLVVLYAEIYGK